MSNAVETELRALINKLQGLYRQCSADIVKINNKLVEIEHIRKENRDSDLERIETIVEDICLIKSEFSRMEISLKGKTNTNTAKIEAIENILKIDIKDEANTFFKILDESKKNKEKIEALESDNKLINLVILDILKCAKFEDEDKRIYIKDELKELEDLK